MWTTSPPIWNLPYSGSRPGLALPGPKAASMSGPDSWKASSKSTRPASQRKPTSMPRPSLVSKEVAT